MIIVIQGQCLLRFRIRILKKTSDPVLRKGTDLDLAQFAQKVRVLIQNSPKTIFDSDSDPHPFFSDQIRIPIFFSSSHFSVHGTYITWDDLDLDSDLGAPEYSKAEI